MKTLSGKHGVQNCGLENSSDKIITDLEPQISEEVAIYGRN